MSPAGLFSYANITVMIIAALVVFGVIFGSFINALVWRLKEQSKKPKAKSKNLSITHGRSICPNCRHALAWYDLVPVFSWLYLRGRCRYCKKPISYQYPAVELVLAAVFVLSYVYWPLDLRGGQIILFIAWLASCVGLLALFVYDLKWMLLPNKIIYSTLATAVLGKLVFLVGYEPDKLHSAGMWVLSVLAASGIFWALYAVSGGKWIGYGDVRLGLITGTLLQTPLKSLLMIFIASVIGCLLVLPTIFTGKRELSAKVPYGPFLITATFICGLFGQSIIDWYNHLLGF